MSERDKRWSPPATTPEQREQQLVVLATDLAEQQLREGIAATPIITHYLKLATEREKLEREKIALESAKLRAQSEAIESDKRNGEIYEKALEAMRSYSGYEEIVEDDY